MPGVEATSKSNKDEDVDKENAEFWKEMLRPVEIKEDVKLMEERKRVSKILHSDAFHKELNKILEQQVKEGLVCGGKAGSATSAAALAALQEISNLLLPQARLGCSVFNRGATMPIIPINDIKSSDILYKKPEKLLRCKLASVYRLIDLHGWATGMQLHASARISKDSDLFLTSCRGLMNHEIQAGNLVKVNLKGEIEDCEGQIDMETWVLHAAIHKVKEKNNRCVLFVRTPSVVAVSCMKSGLHDVCEEVIRLGKVPIFEWGSHSEGHDDIWTEIEAEQDALAKVMFSVENDGRDHRCVLIRNQGLIARGRSIEEAWEALGLAVHACDTQVRLAGSCKNGSLVTIDESRQLIPKDDDILEDETRYQLHYEALMRLLDATGHRTGHMYRHTPVSLDRHRRKGPVSHQDSKQDDGNLADEEDEDDEDVEVPPSATSISMKGGHGDGENEEATVGMMRGPQEPRWLLHMPNEYVREESAAQQPNRPPLVTWRQLPPESRSSSGLVESCTSAHHFAPLGTNPNELLQQQKKVKAKYFTDETTAGHQSKVLRGVEEDKNTEEESGASRVVLVGAVSQGIIDKKHRQDPSVYQTSFSPNPFDRVTEEDLKKYERQVMGIPTDEAPDASSPGITVTESTKVEEVVQPVSTQVQESAPEVVHEAAPTDLEVNQASSTKEGSTLSPGGRIDTIRSDTSGADMSHDDTEKEGASKSTGGKKKKKKFKEMFSFRKKEKPSKEKN